MIEIFLENVEQLLEADVLRNHEVADEEMKEKWDEMREQIHTIRLVLATGKVRKNFYKIYDNRWDFWYNNTDRGLTLGYFIEEHPQYKYLLKGPQPKSFHEIPLEIRYLYRSYLERMLAEDWEQYVCSEEEAIKVFEYSDMGSHE